MNPNENQPPKAYNPLEVMSPGEQHIMEIKRHPFGLFGLYLSGAIAALLLVGAAAVIPRYVGSLTSQDKTGIFVGAMVLLALILLYIYISVTIYQGNRWIVTSDSITQVNQVGLFRKVTSQLSLGNLEDVTFEQNNFVQTLLGFGTLKVETAGERSKFSFPFCPNPADCARKIIAAHEAFIIAQPEHAHEANRGSVETSAFSQQSYPNPVPPVQGGDRDEYDVPN